MKKNTKKKAKISAKKKTKAKIGSKSRVKPAVKKKSKAKKPSSRVKSKAVRAISPAVEVGKSVPDFSLKSSGGSDFQLSHYNGKKVVLYFYPKDDTPGCTLEGQDFTRLASEFAGVNTVVFGISKDSYESHCKFVNKFGFTIELLSDVDEKICRLFDVIQEKNNYGKVYMGIERSTFVIDENRVLVKEYRKVRAAEHAVEVLEFIKSN